MNIQELEKVELILCQFLNELKNSKNKDRYIHISNTLDIISSRKTIMKSFESSISEIFIGQTE